MNNAKLHIHFIGIAGTAMGSAAALAADAGFVVTGSDENIYPPMSDYLLKKGILVKTPYNPLNIPENTDLVVVGNAISRGNAELEHTLVSRRHYISLPEFIKDKFIRNNRSVVITGTHGKTTSTSLATHMLEVAAFSPGYLIGGIPENFPSSARLPTPLQGGIFVIEGDEYDSAWCDKRSKFLHYLPDYVLVNNIEFDHADIFSSLEEIMLSFSRMTSLIPASGHLVVNADSENALRATEKAFCKRITFGIQGGDILIQNIRYTESGMLFDLTGNLLPMKDVFIPLFGEFNVMNATGVLALLIPFRIPESVLRKGLETFKGVRRRREIFFNSNGYLFIEDFAHHPTAIKQTLSSLKKQYPNKRIIAAIEPRSNTMVKNIFQKVLPGSLSEAQTVFCAELHRKEKYAPDEILDLQQLKSDLKNLGTDFILFEKNHEVNQLRKFLKPGDLLILMSNGSFSGLKEKLIQEFTT